MAWAAPASGFGYIAQWGCPGDFYPSGGGIALSSDGLFVGDSGLQHRGVVWLNPSTMTFKGRWNAPDFTLPDVKLGAAPGVVFVHNAGVGGVVTLNVGAGLTVQREFSSARFVAVAGISPTSFVALTNQYKQVLKWDPDGTLIRYWRVIPPIDSPTGFTGAGGGPANQSYITARGAGGPGSRVVVHHLPDYPDYPRGLGSELDAEYKYEWATEGPSTGIKSTGDSVWVISGAGVIQQFSFSGQLLNRYDGRIVPGGLGPLAAITADQSNNIYVIEVPGARGPGRNRVVKLGPGGQTPATGGGPGSPSLQRCSGGTTVRPISVGAALVSRRHPIRQGKMEVFVECGGIYKYCDASANTTTYVPRARKAVRARTVGTAARRRLKAIEGREVERRIPNGVRAKLKAPVPRKALRAIRRAHTRGRSIRIEATVFVFSPSGAKHASKTVTATLR